MARWTTLTELFDRLTNNEARAGNLREEELRLAAAALLVHASAIDGQVDAPKSGGSSKSLLQSASISVVTICAGCWMRPRRSEQDSVDLYRFTSVLCRELDQDGRKRIVEMLWEVVMADGVVHEFESNLVWRTAELLGVSTRDRVRLRQVVASRVGFEPDS